MRLFCIAGMHRSGTSLTSRVMNLLGVQLGPSSELTGARLDNPRGYWENDRLTLLNDRLLAELGGTWSDPPPLPEGWESDATLEPFRRRARVLVDQRFAGNELAGWKDPRNSLLLPFWRSVVPIAGSVFCLRDPRAVAASLARRDGFDDETSALLWLRYMSFAERDPGRVLILEYDDFFEARERALMRLVGFLDVARPDSTQERAIDEFIAFELRHGYPDRAPGPMMERALALYRRLRAHALADDQPLESPADDAEAVERADRPSDRVSLLQRALASQLERVEALMDERDDLVRQRDQAIAQTQELADHRDDLIRQRDTAIAQREEIAVHRDDLIRQRDVAMAQSSEIAAHRDDLIRQRDVAMAQSGEIAAHRDDLIRQRDVAIQQRDELAEHRDDLIRQRDVALQQRDELAERQERAQDDPAPALSYPPQPDNDPAASA
jgi:hypothetical protein